jgi:adenylate kinase
MKKLRFVITGNPGAGKHTIAEIIAGSINTEIIDINDVAIHNNAAGKNTNLGLDVDVKRLARLLDKLLKTKTNLILVGHLAPYVLKPAGITLVAVLRRSPYELEKTLKKRGYSIDKVRENVASEILGISLYDSLKTFGKSKVVEFDTTGKTPIETADEILAIVQNRRKLKLKPKPKLIGIDWLNLVSEKGDLARFFKY